MFRVKRKRDSQIFTVLDTYLDEIYHETYFLVWDNDNWRWRLASNFVPPNVEVK